MSTVQQPHPSSAPASSRSVVSYGVIVLPLLILAAWFGHHGATASGEVETQVVPVASTAVVTRLLTDRMGNALAALDTDGALHIVRYVRREWQTQVLPSAFTGEDQRLRLQTGDIDHDGLVELLVFSVPRERNAFRGSSLPVMPCAVYRHSGSGWKLSGITRRQPFQRGTSEATTISLEGRSYPFKVVATDPAASMTQLLDPDTRRVSYLLEGRWLHTCDLDHDGRPEVLTVREDKAQPTMLRFRLFSYRRGAFRLVWSGLLAPNRARFGGERVLGAVDLLGTGDDNLLLNQADAGSVLVLSLKRPSADGQPPPL